MIEKPAKSVSRRRFLKTAGATALAGPAIIIPGRAQPKTLKIMRVKELVPAYRPWFDDYVSTGTKIN